MSRDGDHASHPRDGHTPARPCVVVPGPLLEVALRRSLDHRHVQAEPRDDDPAERPAVAKRSAKRRRAHAQHGGNPSLPARRRTPARRKRGGETNTPRPLPIERLKLLRERPLLLARVERDERLAPPKGHPDPCHQPEADRHYGEPRSTDHDRRRSASAGVQASRLFVFGRTFVISRPKPLSRSPMRTNGSDAKPVKGSALTCPPICPLTVKLARFAATHLTSSRVADP
jgi:hypothetical protein